MQFQVLVDREPQPVELAFGGESDLRAVSRWRVPTEAELRAGVRDSVEFARLASKRWRYYRQSIATAASLEDFQAIVAQEPQAEVSVLLVVRADWFRRSGILGLAQCRRTYCHHLILEFLSVHPAIVGGAGPRVRGVGAGLLYGLAELAGSLNIGVIWGEATAHSAPFYAKTCRLPAVKDHFFIQKESLEFCRLQFRQKALGRS